MRLRAIVVLLKQDLHLLLVANYVIDRSTVLYYTIAHQLFTQLGAAREIEKLELRMKN